MPTPTRSSLHRCIEFRWSAGLLAAMAAALALAVALPAAAVAGDRYVDDDAICGGNSPCHSTIQAAIDAATGGDTIHVYRAPIIKTKPTAGIPIREAPAATTSTSS